MPSATMTTKGQITIPAAVRDHLGLGPGTRVQFIELPDGGYELKPADLPVTKLKGFFGPWEGPAMSIEEMNEGMARAAAEANK